MVTVKEIVLLYKKYCYIDKKFSFLFRVNINKELWDLYYIESIIFNIYKYLLARYCVLYGNKRGIHKLILRRLRLDLLCLNFNVFVVFLDNYIKILRRVCKKNE